MTVSVSWKTSWNVFFVRGVEHEDTRSELDSYVVNYGIRASFQGGGREFLGENSLVFVPRFRAFSRETFYPEKLEKRFAFSIFISSLRVIFNKI